MSALFAALRELTHLEVGTRDLVDIILVVVVFYLLLTAVKGTRAVSMLLGMFILGGGYLAAQALDLITLATVLREMLFYLPFVIIVLFQHEIRRILAAIGRTPLLRWTSVLSPRQVVINDIVLACETLVSHRYGALIVIERDEGLRTFVETGIPIDARLTYDLLVNLFTPGTPLHDGAAVVQGNRIAAAGCFLPLSVRADLSTTYGSRHRAALGITEETDAVAVVVSEERGALTVAEGGHLHEDLDRRSLRNLLLELLLLGRTGGDA
ncbi:MAG: diadenylate cyclase CdaA [Acidobacteriia bacterium]|nr:diadenylate cyclase CdaA [Terriglobia bacterium]